ncbi:lipoyl synthase [Winkia neuii]|uniref:Lipoyl synthase n=1 Tax=Winkia neuii BV029A5 TaxID=888439 RepID=K0Z6R7_9ACTO|nr:lipoyl synthase [Winkia neuii]EJZ87924.1 lipoyl synthase [Winkia neuii BV029A5]
MSTVPDPEGRKLLRIEVKNSQTPIEKKPAWIKTKAVSGKRYMEMRQRVRDAGSHTVCAEAGCPNIFECWEDREATFLIGGALCTRRCDFCDIATGKPTEYDKDEPRRVASEIAALQLNYATVTGVSRDDLEDGASWLYAETCRQIHQQSPSTGVELLVDDFRGKDAALDEVFSSKPEVFGHNLETVPRIFKKIRPAFRYERSLEVLRKAHEAGLITKSNFILGMGETTDEIVEAMKDMRSAEVDLLTITQYLRPSPLHHPIDRWVKPKEFVELSKIAYDLGFKGVMSGPMVRSSYRAGRLWAKAMRANGRPLTPEQERLYFEGTTRQEASTLLADNPALANA